MDNNDFETRIQFLLESHESLHANLQEQAGLISEQRELIEHQRLATAEQGVLIAQHTTQILAVAAALDSLGRTVTQLARVVGAHEGGIGDLKARVAELEKRAHS